MSHLQSTSSLHPEETPRIPPAKGNWWIRFIARMTRSNFKKMTGRDPEGAIGPFHAFAHAPGLLLGYGMLETATAKAHRVPERLKMLAQLKAASLVQCEYCIDLGSQIARRGGVTDAQLLALPRFRESGEFTDTEKVVLEYADGMSRTPVFVPDELFAKIRSVFSDAQIVELTSVIALENMRGRFNLTLGFGAAGFSEGMVCAVPEGATASDRPAARTAGATRR